MAEVRHVMGMPVTVAGGTPGAVERVFAWLRWVDATFSTYRTDSEISRIAQGDCRRPRRTRSCARCSRAATRCAWRPAATSTRATRAASTPPASSKAGRSTAPRRSSARAPLLLDAGGDVLVRGGGWRVGVRHPRERDLLSAVLEADELAVATSGAYERGPHIVDPHTGWPPSGVLSVTVIGPDLATADAYATAAFAMGEAGPAWTARLRDYEAMTVLDGEEVLATPGFVRRCAGRSIAASLRAA